MSVLEQTPIRKFKQRAYDSEPQQAWMQKLFAQDIVFPKHEQSWLGRIREQARESLSEMEFPHRKLEDWRYSNARRLLDIRQSPPEPSFLTDLDSMVSASEITGLDCYKLVFADNRFCPKQSRLNDLPVGVRVQSLADALQRSPNLQYYLTRSADIKQDVFVALNTAILSDGLFIEVEDNIHLDKPLEILYINRQGEISAPRVLVVIKNNATLSLIERFVGSDPTQEFQNAVEEIYIGAHSALTQYRLIEESNAASHLSNVYVQQAENSFFYSHNQELSGAWTRTHYNLELQGKEAACQLQGLFVLDGMQHSNVHTHIQHAVPACRSQQHYKGILLDSSRAVFDGKIVVAKDAQNTDAYLKNDNLLLSATAEVDTKPQLEIYADNVKCGHGTTVGQIDPEQLYYLRSRGINEADATRMLCDGFAVELFYSCDIEALREYLLAAMRRTLDNALSAGVGA